MLKKHESVASSWPRFQGLKPRGELVEPWQHLFQHSPNLKLPSKYTAKKAAAYPGVTAVTTPAAAAVPAAARRDVGIKAVITVAGMAATIVRAMVAAGADFDCGRRRFQRFCGTSRNGKSTPRDECRRQKGGGRDDEFFHVSLERSKCWQQ